MTGKEVSLTPFNEGQKVFDKKIKSLRAVGNKSKSRRIINRSIERIVLLVDQWKSKAALPEIQARKEVNQLPSSMEDVTALIEEGTGKRHMDDIRNKLQAFKQTEFQLLAVRKMKSEEAVLITKYVIVLGAGIILFSSIIWSLWFAGNISKPLRTLKDASDSIREGIYPEKINIDTKDEIFDLGKTFEKMIDKIKTNEQSLLLKKEEAESAKEEADKANMAKSIFLANMSHEIRTPLNAVLGYAQILKRDKSLGKDQLEAIQAINKSGNHLLEMINDILDLSKIEAGKQELNLVDFDLGALTNDLRSIFSARCEEKRLVLKVDECPKGKVLVIGDLGKIRQVLINLIGNAVKFTDSGSVAYRFSKQEHDNRFLFEVTDTGAGIPINLQESIFDPFRQEQEGLNKGGTGLGLAICRRQVKQMGGDLKVQSEAGKGSRFYFSLPLEQVNEARSIQKTDNRYDDVIGLKDEYKVKALIVDDVKENRDVLSLFLKNIGVFVMTAENGRAAVEQTENFEPHIIFMDVRMPVMDGVEAFHEIKKQFSQKEIKMVCITASTLQHQQQKYIDMGFDFYIPKPFHHNDVLLALETCLNIEYNYNESTKTIPNKSDEIDWSKVRIPAEIKTRIIKSAGLYAVTPLEKIFDQLESVETGGKELASLLRNSLKSYDMDGIVSIMKKVE